MVCKQFRFYRWQAMHKYMHNKCCEKELSIKVTKLVFIGINLLVIAITFYVLKHLWKGLKAEEMELNRQKLLRNTELPIEEMLSTVATRKSVLVTIVTTAVTLAAIGIIGAYRQNSWLIGFYDIFSGIITIILALGFNNYIDYCLYYSLAVGITSFATIIGFILMRLFKVEPNWIKQRQLLMNNSTNSL